MNCEAIHCPDVGTVRFAIYPDGFDGPRIIAHISERALRECFGAHPDEPGLISACQANFGLIEAKALARYAARPGAAVLLAPADFGAVDALAEV
ncbi:hypothetical protein QTI33_18015 [Variovorax sp. J22P271]|uniref:hypothetical protein n=1 Tax=Variovorax davisae TaxID=3053515 RepID=UPI002575DB56|nr:hypothetical protein [Variovorax sp. J22P271]MDM0034035.1 hypothetical protein [Variovorax sp. J22P271]